MTEVTDKLRAPFEQPGDEEDPPELEMALKAMAFDITIQIRGYVKPPRLGSQQSLELGA